MMSVLSLNGGGNGMKLRVLIFSMSLFFLNSREKFRQINCKRYRNDEIKCIKYKILKKLQR